MKKITLILLFIISICSLVSCGQSKSDVVKEVVNAFLYPENAVIPEEKKNGSACILYSGENTYDGITWRGDDFKKMIYQINWQELVLPISNYQDDFVSNETYLLGDYSYDFNLNKDRGEIHITNGNQMYLLRYFKYDSNRSPFKIVIYEYSDNEVISCLKLLWDEDNSLVYLKDGTYYVMSLCKDIVKVAEVESNSESYEACRISLIV